MGCTADTVGNQEAGTRLSLSRVSDLTAWTDRREEMRNMRARGATVAAIGQRFGLTAERVRQTLHAANGP